MLVTKVDVLPVTSSRRLRDFIRLPWSLYADDPSWVPPLLVNERQRVGPPDAKLSKDARRRLWVAYINGAPVGRISAQLKSREDAAGDDDVGHFGWIESIDSEAVFAALFGEAENWLRTQGMTRCTGPFNFSINEACGLLVEGFDTPPMTLMPHARPYYADQLSRLGYAKEVDLLAYKIDLREPLTPRIERLKQRAVDDPKLVLRRLNTRKFGAEIHIILDLFNDAWSGNWGFEPFSTHDMRKMARMLRPLLIPDAACIAEYDERPVAFVLGLPNINEMIRDMDGRLFPLGWAKLLYRLKLRRYTSGRIPLMGVRKEFQGTPMGAAIAIAVIEKLRLACLRNGVYTGELSWVLETNQAIRSIIQAFPADPYKTYRIYARALS